MVRGSRGHLPAFSVQPLIDKQLGISPVGKGRNRALREKDYKTDWHCDSLSLSFPD